MNNRQKEVQKKYLNNEEKILKDLKKVYHDAEKQIDDKIASLLGRADVENLQSIIYQVEYQKALKQQISGILDTMNSEQFTTVSGYLAKCYEDGYIGAMYDLDGQGIPLTIPIDQQDVQTALVKDTKLSNSLYTEMGKNTTILKGKISSSLSRGIASGSSYADIAKDINRQSQIGLNKSMRIARTEGHRVSQAATMDAQHKVKEKGADIVKQWDSTIDRRTRESHVYVDGQIRELDEPFSNGLQYPGDPSGKASEVINCRCVLLQRAKWALDEGELITLQERAEYYGLDKTENFEDFKKKYIKANEVPTTDLLAKNKNGEDIEFDFKGNNEKFKDSKRTIESLSNEYNTRLQKVTVGAKRFAGDVDMSGATMRLNSSAPDIAIHEFAHTLANSSAQKYGLTDDAAFWKEIKSIRRQYRKGVGDDVTKWISSYEHSSNSVDEFFAEAFTQAKMREMGMGIPTRYGTDFTYSQKVLDVSKKYFGLDKSQNAIYNGIGKNNVQKKAFAKVRVDDIPSMDEDKFNRIKINLKKNGITVIQDIDGDKYLKAMNAEAITLSDGSAVIFQSGRIPSASAVYEEVIHTTQIKNKGMILTAGDKESTIEYLNREIEANEKLLSHKDAYGLTSKDIESVEENLKMYYEAIKGVNFDV